MLVHFRNPFFVVWLVILAPSREFLFASERFTIAFTVHDHSDLGSQVSDKVADRPAFPYVLVHIGFHIKVILIVVAFCQQALNRFVHLIEPVEISCAKFEGTVYFKDKVIRIFFNRCDNKTGYSQRHVCDNTLVWFGIVTETDDVDSIYRVRNIYFRFAMLFEQVAYSRYDFPSESFNLFAE